MDAHQRIAGRGRRWRVVDGDELPRFFERDRDHVRATIPYLTRQGSCSELENHVEEVRKANDDSESNCTLSQQRLTLSRLGWVAPL